MHIKKLILLLFLVPVLAQAQKTTGPNYTYIAQRYEWLAGVFKALGIPAGDSAQFQTGQEMRAGALYYDSVGVDSGLYVWSGLDWRQQGVGEVTQSALDDTAAAIRGDFPAGGFFTPNQTSTGATVHNASLEDFTLDSVGTFSIKRNAITRLLLNGSETTIQSPDGLTFLQAANTGISVFAGPTANNGRMSLGDNVASFGIESSYTTGLTLVPSLATLRNTTGSLNIQAGGGASDSLRLIHFNFSDDTTLHKLQARNTVSGALVDTYWPVGGGNLLFDSLGTAGISPVTTRNDTLYSRRISVAGGLTIDTTATGGLVIDASGVSGGGTDNANAGAFYRWLKPSTQEIKTFAAGYGALIDSISNTDALTVTIDTTTAIASKDWVSDRISEIPAASAAGETVKTMYLSSPTSADDLTYYYIDSAITVTKVADVLTGSSPSVTYNVFFASTRNSGTPDSLFSAPRVSTSITGATTTTFNDNTIPAGSWIWLKTYATGGTVNDISVNLLYPGGGGSGGGSSEWGAISGTLSDQTDLQAALDAKLNITTTSPAHTGTTPSGSGVVASSMYSILSSDHTLTSTTSAQTAFPSGQDVWTLQANTTYEFEGIFSLVTTSGSSYTGGMGFLLGGGATITSAMFQWQGFKSAENSANTATAAGWRTDIATVDNMQAASTVGGFSIWFKGIIRVDAGGTVTPEVKLTAALASIVMESNSWIRFTPIGTGSFTSIGNVN